VISRRFFLGLGLFAGLIAPFSPGLGLWERRRRERLHIVNGWILTEADLKAIRKYDL
jgi:hypothetical protein